MYRFTESGSILRESDGAQIPCDDLNRDYRAIIASGAEIKPFDPPAPRPKRLTIEQLEDLVDYLMTEREPETAPLGYPDEAPQPLPPNPAETKMSEYGPVGGDPPGDKDAEDALTTDHLLDALRANVVTTQDVIAKLSGGKRQKFTELLNVELAELNNKIAAGYGADSDIARKRDVERLKDLFARVGEA